MEEGLISANRKGFKRQEKRAPTRASDLHRTREVNASSPGLHEAGSSLTYSISINVQLYSYTCEILLFSLLVEKIINWLLISSRVYYIIITI